MPHSVVTLGIDIGKAYLDTCLLTEGEHGQYPNDNAGIAALVLAIQKSPCHEVRTFFVKINAGYSSADSSLAS